MNVLSPKKWMIHPERRELVLEKNFFDVMPVNIHLAPALTCNYACPSCTYGKSKIDYAAKIENGEKVPREKVMMTKENMETVIDKIYDAGVKRIVFTGGGEPLLNKNTLYGMRYSIDKGISTALFTNGSLLSKEKADELLDINPSFIRISLNAGSGKVHRLFHGTKKSYFNQVIDNLGYLAKEKVRRGSDTEVSVGVIVSPLNFSEIPTIAEAIYEIDSQGGDIRNLNYRPTVNYGGHQKQLGEVASEGIDFVRNNFPEYAKNYAEFFTSNKQFPKEMFERAVDLVEESKEILEGLVNVNMPLQKIEDLCNSSLVRPYEKCLASPWVVKVGPSGDVYHCVELGMEEEYSLGSLIESSFAEIWKSDNRKEVIEKVNCGSLDDICGQGCMLHDLNTTLKHIEEGDDEFVNEVRGVAEEHYEDICLKVERGELDKDTLNAI